MTKTEADGEYYWWGLSLVRSMVSLCFVVVRTLLFTATNILCGLSIYTVGYRTFHQQIPTIVRLFEAKNCVDARSSASFLWLKPWT